MKLHMQMNDSSDEAAVFGSAQEALLWSVEILRRRRFPKLASAWQALVALAEKAASEAASWENEVIVTPETHLPRAGADRYALALRVMMAVHCLPQVKGPGHGGLLLLEQAWGDWVEDARLQRALRFQELMRQRGERALVNYRYTLRQLAERHGVDAATIWRRSRAALLKLEDILVAKGLVVLPDCQPHAPGVAAGDVRFFKRR